MNSSIGGHGRGTTASEANTTTTTASAAYTASTTASVTAENKASKSAAMTATSAISKASQQILNDNNRLLKRYCEIGLFPPSYRSLDRKQE